MGDFFTICRLPLRRSFVFFYQKIDNYIDIAVADYLKKYYCKYIPYIYSSKSITHLKCEYVSLHKKTIIGEKNFIIMIPISIENWTAVQFCHISTTTERKQSKVQLIEAGYISTRDHRTFFSILM